MGFRLVSTSVTLNDLEQRNLFCFILPNLADLGATYVRVVEDRPILSSTEM